jgi:hypothetical protein
MNAYVSRTAKTIVAATLLVGLVSGIGEAARIAPAAISATVARQNPDGTPSEQNAVYQARAESGAILPIP